VVWLAELFIGATHRVGICGGQKHEAGGDIEPKYEKEVSITTRMNGGNGSDGRNERRTEEGFAKKVVCVGV